MVRRQTSTALGDVGAVRSRLRRNQSAAESQDQVGKTPLHYCAASRLWKADQYDPARFAEVARLLLDSGADVEAQCDGPLQPTPFHFAAAQGGNVYVAKLLVENGAHASDPGLFFEVLRSMKKQDDEFSQIGELMLENGIDLNGGYVPTLTYLHGQSRREDVQATKWLLDHGADVNARIDDGRTSLHVSADRSRGTKVIKLLLDHGAELNARDHLGNTPLYYARQSEKHRIVKFLM